jgi:hypothetical protein
VAHCRADLHRQVDPSRLLDELREAGIGMSADSGPHGAPGALRAQPEPGGLEITRDEEAA